MFCLYFTESPVKDFDTAVASKTDHFKPLFHHALKHGVYLPPSAYETCFISTAHTEADIARTAEVLCAGLERLN
ncbi:MAG: aspartate aminotransferase family protein, partial [Verrucomicrobiota bacterium]